MKRPAVLLVALFSAACFTPAPPPKPPIPPVVKFVIGIVTQDRDNQPIVGAHVKLHEGASYVEQRTEGNGLTVFVIDPSLVQTDVMITADGYIEFDAHIDVVNQRNYFYNLELMPPPAPVYTHTQLADLQGDLMLWVPKLAPQCPVDPVTGIRCQADNGAAPRGVLAGWVWTLWTYRYDAAGRQDIYAAAKAQGYTHVAVQAPCDGGEGYHGLSPDDCVGYGEKVNTVLRELAAQHLIAICAGITQNTPAAPGLDHSLCPVVMDDWDNTTQKDCHIQEMATEFPDALLYIEIPTGASLDPDACTPPSLLPAADGGAWIRETQRKYPNFAGVLYEFDHVGLASDISVAVKLHPFWRDAQEVRFETDTYQKFWGSLDEGSEIAYNDQLGAATPWLKGFMSGGTSHTPPAATSNTFVITAPGDLVPINQVIWEQGTNAGSWPMTTRLTQIDLRSEGVHLEFDKKDGQDRWPDNVTPGWSGSLQYSIGLCERLDGLWHCAAPIEVWYGLAVTGGPIQNQQVTCSQGYVGQIACNWFYDVRWGAMNGYQPKPGEEIGIFVVAGDARNHFNPVQERSNIVVFPLPTDPTTITVQ